MDQAYRSLQPTEERETAIKQQTLAMAADHCMDFKAPLLAVYGVWVTEGKVRHLLASKLVDRTELLGAQPTMAREFC